jgi:hypothetical protein
MRHTDLWMTLLTAATIATVLADPARAQIPRGATDRPDGLPMAPLLTEIDPDSGMAFGLFADGEELVVRGQAADVQLEKRNRRDGSTTFSVTDGSDAVTVRISAQAIVATRQGVEATLAMKAPDAGGGRPALQSLLNDSTAIVAIDRLVARLGVRTSRTSLVEALRQVHVWTRLLRGQPVAVRSLTAGLSRPGGGVVRTAGGGMSCWMSYEREIWEAYTDFAGCYRNSLEVQDGEFLRDACGILYYVRAESAWFELLSCVAFPW